MSKRIFILILITYQSFAFDSDGLRPTNLDLQNDLGAWREENCKPYKSESIFRTINQKVEDYLFEIKYIRGNGPVDETNDEWYDPECGFSSVTVTNSKNPSFKGFIEYQNGYKPKLAHVIKNKKNEKYALISHFSGGTAGSYFNVISLQSGKDIGTLEDAKIENGLIKSHRYGFETYEQCSSEFNALYEVTFMNDKQIKRFIKDDYFPYRSMVGSNPKEFKSRSELKKECPKLDEKIIKGISNMS